MSRLDAPPRVTVKPAVNVYTGLALISALATIAAFGYALSAYGKLVGWF